MDIKSVRYVIDEPDSWPNAIATHTAKANGVLAA